MSFFSVKRIVAILWLCGIVLLSLFKMLFQKSNVDRAESVFLGPSFNFIFGTDALGRDLFWRVVAASMNSLFIGIVGLILAVLFAFILGGLAGWYQGWMDRIFMRTSEVLLALPGFLLAAVFIFWAQEKGQLSSIFLIIIALGMTQWMTMARILRAQVIAIKVEKFIEAARALGAKDGHIFCCHVLPHVRYSWMTFVLLQLPSFLMFEGFLSFVGIGV